MTRQRPHQRATTTARAELDRLDETAARLGLVRATRQVLANSLTLIGVSAPDAM